MNAEQSNGTIASIKRPISSSFDQTRFLFLYNDNEDQISGSFVSIICLNSYAIFDLLTPASLKIIGNIKYFRKKVFEDEKTYKQALTQQHTG